MREYSITNLRYISLVLQEENKPITVSSVLFPIRSCCTTLTLLLVVLAFLPWRATLTLRTPFQSVRTDTGNFARIDDWRLLPHIPGLRPAAPQFVLCMHALSRTYSEQSLFKPLFARNHVDARHNRTNPRDYSSSSEGVIRYVSFFIFLRMFVNTDG